ncbi:diadenosine tetraphosphatase [Roseivivax jejudonensis]|uniref:Diadenosine tetraphosphatase n=1 Tax=Roseivivax jejudonensis TaxID=1529041 RepID=A0A1X6YEU0_9RHOB|nr:metallophosphoesterase family protein [Roseivivax jejudonensis]SLN19298.1 diadenosine tetraphosphatase [Roseivivax jejudonensis]
MDPIFAVGDIHGQADELDRVLRLIDADPDAGATVVFLGDLVDRGPDSRRVIETVRAGQESGRDWISLLGNHDLFFRDFLDPRGMSDAEAAHWLGPNLGGDATLASYGIDPRSADIAAVRAIAREQVDPAHQEWLAGLAPSHETAAQIFVHAGIMPGVPFEAQDPDDLVWIREPFLSDPRDHGRLVVHGHTAAEGPVHRGNRVNLDGGAGFGRPLCAAILHGAEVALLTETGRVPLRPDPPHP